MNYNPTAETLFESRRFYTAEKSVTSLLCFVKDVIIFDDRVHVWKLPYQQACETFCFQQAGVKNTTSVDEPEISFLILTVRTGNFMSSYYVYQRLYTTVESCQSV
jgi:hypothetical protein